MRQIILDTETTGLDPQDGHKIIEIGCIELIDRQFTHHNFHSYINPNRDIDVGATKVHGLTRKFLADKPLFSELAEKLLAYLEGAELIIHNAPFDVGFLNTELSFTKFKHQTIESICQITDTLLMARQKHPGQRNSLDALCKRYQVDNSNRNLHGALLDANLLSQVYLIMTGGQTSFGLDESPAAKPIVEAVSDAERREIKDRQLIVLSANDAELIAHQKILKNMKNPLWNELSEIVEGS